MGSGAPANSKIFGFSEGFILFRNRSIRFIEKKLFDSTSSWTKIKHQWFGDLVVHSLWLTHNSQFKFSSENEIFFTNSRYEILVIFKFSNFRDRALQNFHTLKIKEINKIIRELWQLVYKGQVRHSI